MRSAHNVGSLLRTADGLGVEKVYLAGYTPYPPHPGDARMPHESSKIGRQIHKTALGAEESIAWEYTHDIYGTIDELKANGYVIGGLEQTKASIMLPEYKPADKLVLIVGNEVAGIEERLLELSDLILEIPMSGKKESLNVVQAAAIALYHLRYY